MIFVGADKECRVFVEKDCFLRNEGNERLVGRARNTGYSRNNLLWVHHHSTVVNISCPKVKNDINRKPNIEQRQEYPLSGWRYVPIEPNLERYHEYKHQHPNDSNDIEGPPELIVGVEHLAIPPVVLFQ